ncbi:conserved hypothetical protein [Thermotomaculum hydrothermale]|uniref:Sulfotransferase n=1 Tax=Thermotomaculum hydrothermale TaxID=981385 RepID=A0A7R6PGL3_9BACT|nr:sulfotransferase [Thermotomaculum hydrothermale]BBB33393.1 conserved hypothetical protein [Thermotomaculum hydrothermale]
MEDKFIFVVGNSRSGTTMTARILGKNKEVFTFNEIHFWGEIWSKSDENKVITEKEAIKLASYLLFIQRVGYYFKKNFDNRFENDAKMIVDSISNKDLTMIDVYRAFLFFETKKNGKRIPCEQTPRNLFYIEEILKFFPNAKIVNLVRDPRDVLLSQKNKWKRKFYGEEYMPLKEMIRVRANYHPVVISRLWNSSVRIAKANDSKDFFKTFKFECILNNPESFLKDLCNFTGIGYSKDMLNVPKIGSSLKKDNEQELGIDKNSASNWKKGGLNSTEVFLCQKICGKLMQDYGYKIDFSIKPNFLLLFYYYVSLPVKLGFSFLLNLDRMKSIAENIRKRL